MVEYTIRFILSFVFTAILARHLELEAFGIWTMALVYFALAASLSKLGLNEIVVKKLARGEAEGTIYLGTSFWLKIVMSVLLIIGFYIHSFGSDDLSHKILAIFLLMSIFQGMEVSDFYFQSAQKYIYISVVKIVQIIMGFSLKILFFFHFKSLEMLAWALVLESALLALLQFTAMYKYGCGLFIRYFSFSIAMDLLKESWPLLLTGVSIFLYSRIDQMLIYSLLGTEDAATYSMAIRVIEMFYVIPTMLLGLIYPLLLSKSKDGIVSLKVFLEKLVTYSIYLTVIICVILFLFAKIFIVSIYGDNFEDSVALIWPLSLNFFFVCLGLISNSLIVIDGTTIHLLCKSFFTLLTNVILNFIFIFYLGLQGGVFAVLFTYLIQVLFIDRLFPVTNDFRLLWLETLGRHLITRKVVKL